jgi:hypothetical protein
MRKCTYYIRKRDLTFTDYVKSPVSFTVNFKIKICKNSCQNLQIKKLANVGSGSLREVILAIVRWWFPMTVCSTLEMV